MATTKNGTLINTSVRSTMYRAGRKSKITKICIHHWGRNGQKHNNVVSYLSEKRTVNPTSAHYVASAGRINEIVNPNNTAWHAGNGNSYTIGIECRPEMSDGDFETVAQLVAYLRSIYGNLPLVGHKDILSTECPGKWYNKLSDLSNRANEINRGKEQSSAPAKKPSKPSVSKPAASTSFKLKVDGRFGMETVSELQRRAGVKVDGRASKDTWAALQRKKGMKYVDGIISKQSYKATELGNGIVPGKYWNYTGRGSSGSTFIKAIQKDLGVAQDGILYTNTIKKLQTRLNNDPNYLK